MPPKAREEMQEVREQLRILAAHLQDAAKHSTEFIKALENAKTLDDVEHVAFVMQLDLQAANVLEVGDRLVWARARLRQMKVQPLLQL